MKLTSIELRQYAMKPGRRDELIALFEREFIETQEAAGIRLIGLFRDLDRPDQFVWLRGYPTPADRKPALEAFYTSDHWFAHRAATNATMVSSDDVLLLRPLDGSKAVEASAAIPAGVQPARGVVVLGLHRLSGPDDPLIARFEADIAPALAQAGLEVRDALITDPAPNVFPRHPVREGEWVLVWTSVLPDEASAQSALRSARACADLSEVLATALQLLVLAPTNRSRMHA